jgi:fibronectin type 3 domain-containing protein
MSLDLEWSNTSVTSTYFNDTSVVNGLLYWYEIAAVNSIGDGWLSNSVEATPGTPSPPLSLSYEEGAGSINLTWSPPLTDNGSPIIEYRVFTGPFGTTLLTTVESSTTYFKVTGITNSNQYFFTIRAVNNNGMSESSNWVSIQMPPHPPSNLTAIAGNGFVNLNWEFIPSSGGQPVYMCNILRKGGNETDWTIIGTVDGTTTRFNDSHEDGHNGPLNGVSYQYYVTASNYAAQSEPSNNISIKVGETPGHPLNLHTGLGKSSISLYWSAPNSDGGCPISWYVIYRGSDPSSLVPLANVSGTLTSFNDSTVIFGEKTYYSVTAVNSIGESDFGDMINATAMAEGNGAGNDIVLLAGIGIIAVVVIATIAFLALRKK